MDMVPEVHCGQPQEELFHAAAVDAQGNRCLADRQHITDV